VAVLTWAALAGAAKADTLTTAAPNNGSGGTFFNLTASTATLTFDSFAAPFSAAAGTPVSVEVYSRPGSYVTFTGSSAGWTLLGTVTGTSAGSTVFSADINLPSPVTLTPGNTIGFYLHSITAGKRDALHGNRGRATADDMVGR
jgi:hypothetical protein